MVSPLSMMMWNAQSVRSKFREFFAMIERLGILISLISETHLTSNDRFYHPEYRTYRLDRSDGRRGGGVAIVVRRGVSHRLLPCPRTKTIESIAVELFLSGRRLVIVSVYFPGSSDPRTLSLYRRDLEILSGLGTDVLIGGDLNARHPFWGCAGTNAAGTVLFQEAIGGDMFLHFPDSPTHFPHSGSTPSTLDLLLTKGFPAPTDITVDPCLCSDHVPVFFTVVDGVELADIPHQVVKDFTSANWRRYSSMITLTLSDLNADGISSTQDIEDTLGRLTAAIQEADRSCIPRKRRQFGTFGLTREILTLIGLRKSAIRGWQRTRDPAFRQRARLLDLEVEKATESLVNKRFGDAVQRLNDDPGPHRRKFWKLVRNLRKRPSVVPTLQTDDGPLVTQSEKCEAFATHYRDIAGVASTQHSPSLGAEIRQHVNRLRCTPLSANDVPVISRRIVEDEIRWLKNGKAPGLDGITALHLKHLPATAILLITEIFNACLRLGFFPTQWKLSKVISICKPDKPSDDVTSYRMLSLLPTLSKLFERILLPHLRNHIEENSVIPSFQYGFQPGKSSVHQLYRVTKLIKGQLSQRRTVGMLCLDLKCAFDCVQHDSLMYKMSKLRFPLYLLKIVDSFLTCREFKVAIGNTFSTVMESMTGVPQGSVISPTLFNLYVHDIPVPADVTMAQLADDSAYITASHRTSTIVRRLQLTGNRVVRFFKKWGVRVSGPKSSAILFTKKLAARHRATRNLVINGDDVQWSNVVKYLGMQLDRRLTFGPHIQSLITRSEKAMRCLYPLINRRSRLRMSNRLLLFKSIYRPTFTYGAPVFTRCAATHKRRLQLHQNRILKLMMNKPRRFSTSRLHNLAGVDMINDHLSKLSENFIYSCLNNTNNDIADLVEHL